MGRKKNSNQIDIDYSEVKEKVESLKKKLSDKKNSRKKNLTEEELREKQLHHREKIVKKQEDRLDEHIKRVKRKEESASPNQKERFYVTNAKILEELDKLKDKDGNIDPTKTPSEEFGKMILMIAKRLSNHSNFKNYPYEVKQDMISYACYKCIQGVRNYNFKFKNAFAYFTTACYNSFVSTVSAYYKQINIKKDLMKKAIEKLESTKDLNSSKVLNKFVREYLGEDVEVDESGD